MICLQLIKIPYQGPLHSNLDLVEKESVLLKGFRTKIREKYRLPGEVTIHRSAWDSTTRQWGLSPAITENELILRSGEAIVVLYDERIKVAPGGYGTGADIRSGIGTVALAEGGYGTGGKIDGFGNFKGGHGVGGDGKGVGISGTAGAGHGGLVVAAPGLAATAGDGTGGDLIQNVPDAMAHLYRR